jgi:small-conductance mechanosensitive channel
MGHRTGSAAPGVNHPQRYRALRQQAVAQARSARRYLVLLVPLVVGVLVLNHYRRTLVGTNVAARAAVVVVLVIAGWALARQLGRFLQPKLLSRLDPGTAGVTSFLIRLVTMAVMLVVALRIAGLKPGTITLGASFTAVVFGLAAQQTLGNIFAGIVLLSARPFTVGDRVRFNGFGMDVEGTVVSHGLLYVNCHDGRDLVLIPNNTALTMSVRPIREPASVEMRARLPKEADPEAVEKAVASSITVPVSAPPRIVLEAFERSEVVMRIHAAPVDPAHGGALAREVLRAVDGLAGNASRNGGATGDAGTAPPGA